MEQLNTEAIEQQQQRWIDGWAEMMIQIWQDRLQFFNIRRTGSLLQSFSQNVKHEGFSASISLRFAAYGIYQAFGVGFGYTHGNGGDLPFLGAAYRREHRLDVPRKVGPAWGGYYTSGEPRHQRDWFSAKLYASVMRMKETMAHIAGEEAAAVMCDALVNVRSALGRSSGGGLELL